MGPPRVDPRGLRSTLVWTGHACHVPSEYFGLTATPILDPVDGPAGL